MATGEDGLRNGRAGNRRVGHGEMADKDGTRPSLRRPVEKLEAIDTLDVCLWQHGHG